MPRRRSNIGADEIKIFNVVVTVDVDPVRHLNQQPPTVGHRQVEADGDEADIDTDAGGTTSWTVI